MSKLSSLPILILFYAASCLAEANHFEVIETVNLSEATPSDLKRAFVFRQLIPLPASNLMFVSLSNGQSAIFDRDGRMIKKANYTNPDFREISPDGLYSASNDSRMIGYINPKGEWVIQPQFQVAYSFHNGLAIASSNISAGVGVIDTAGKWVLAPHYTSVTPITKDWIVTERVWFVRLNGTPWKTIPIANPLTAIFNSKLVVVNVNGKFALFDKTGKPANTEMFEEIQPLIHNRAIAKRGGKWGVLNEEGKWVVLPRFDVLKSNDDGTLRAISNNKIVIFNNDATKEIVNYRPLIKKTTDVLNIQCKDWLCGYVNNEGKWVINPQFEQAWPFQNGIARVKKNDLIAYIDTTGHFLTPEPPRYAAAPWLWRPDSMHDAQSNNGGAVFGYIDRTGKFIIPPVFSIAGDFSEKLAPVRSQQGSFGYISRDGNWAIQPIFRSAEPFAEGLGLVNVNGNDFCYIDQQVKVKLNLDHGVQATSFKNGVAEVKNWNGEISVINKSGKVISPSDITNLKLQSSQELQRLSINGGKWGYADKNDHFVIAPKFDDAKEFSEDFAAVRIGKEWGYINQKGKIAIPPAFEEVTNFIEGLAAVRQGETWTYVDIKGATLPTENLTVANAFHDGVALVGVSLESAKIRVSDNYSSQEDFMPGWPPMLSDGGDFHENTTWISLIRGGTYSQYNDLKALINKKGQLIIPRLLGP